MTIASRPSAGGSKHHISRLILFNLGLTLGSLVIGELVFGDWFDAIPPVRVAHDVTWRFDAEPLYGRREAVVYHRDRFGLRGRYASLDAIDILTLGGSTTDQRYLTEGETWQDRLAQGLAERGHPCFIGNAGIDGQSSIGNIEALNRWLIPLAHLKPRLVLVYAGINDVALGEAAAFDTIAVNPGRRFERWVRDRSALARLWMILKGMRLASKAGVGHGAEHFDGAGARWITVPSITAATAELNAFGGRMTDLVGAIRSWGAEPVLVTQPRADLRYRDGAAMVAADAEMPAATLARFNDVTLKVCGETGAICLDLARELRLDGEDYYDRLHYTPAGAAKIGRYLAEKLPPCRQIPSAVVPPDGK